MNKRDLPAWFDSELDWYANEYEGEMGLRGVPIEPSQSGYDESNADDHRVRAATRGRKVEAALTGLRTGWRLLLLAAHTRISPRRHRDVHAAHEEMIREERTTLMEATAAYRRKFIHNAHAGRR